MSISLNLGKWGNIFPVPSSVVDEDIKLASENQLKVLLYVLRNSEKQLENENIAIALGINSEDVGDALSFWKERGLMKESNTAKDVVKNKDNSFKEETKPARKPRPLSRAQKPDSIFVANRLRENKELAALLEEVESLFGKPISNGDTATLVMLHETDGLPCDVLMMLVYYCHSIGKDNMRYIEKVAVNWAADEIFTIEQAEERIKNMEMYGEAWGKVASIFGISNTGSPTKAQQENANRWINEWKFSEEMLREAYERCVNKKNTFNITYTNGILKNWHKYNITSLKELNDFESKSKNNKKSSSFQFENTSYDIEQYEKYSMFD